MKYKTFVIERYYTDVSDARPPRNGKVIREGTQWVTVPKRMWSGFKCKILWGEYCMGGKGNIDLKTDSEAYENALIEIQVAIENVISKVMESCNVREKEAIQLLKES